MFLSLRLPACRCMLSSPLILGNDPRTMSKATLSILLAKEIIALNQDPLSKQARKVGRHTTVTPQRHDVARVGPAMPWRSLVQPQACLGSVGMLGQEQLRQDRLPRACSPSPAVHVLTCLSLWLSLQLKHCRIVNKLCGLLPQL